MITRSLLISLICLLGGTHAKAQTLQQYQALKTQVASLQATVTSLQRTLATIQQNRALQLGPFVYVNPDPEHGVAGPNIIFHGANVHITSGSGITSPNGTFQGLGNLIIGYNEDEFDLASGDRAGVHNLIVGRYNKFTATAFGGIVQGDHNTITAEENIAIGGGDNVATGSYSVVIGGSSNRAASFLSAVIGGFDNQALGTYQLSLGGCVNTSSIDYGATLGTNNGTTIGLK